MRYCCWKLLFLPMIFPRLFLLMENDDKVTKAFQFSWRPGSRALGLRFLWFLFFIIYRAYSINSSFQTTDDVTGHRTMNSEDRGQKGIYYNAVVNSPLPGLWCDRGRRCPCLQWSGSDNPEVCSNILAGMRHLTREPQSYLSDGTLRGHLVETSAQIWLTSMFKQLLKGLD